METQLRETYRTTEHFLCSTPFCPRDGWEDDLRIVFLASSRWTMRSILKFPHISNLTMNLAHSPWKQSRGRLNPCVYSRGRVFAVEQ